MPGEDTTAVDPRGWSPESAAMAVNICVQVIHRQRRGQASDRMMAVAADLLAGVAVYLHHLEAMPEPGPGGPLWADDEDEYLPVES